MEIFPRFWNGALGGRGGLLAAGLQRWERSNTILTVSGPHLHYGRLGHVVLSTGLQGGLSHGIRAGFISSPCRKH